MANIKQEPEVSNKIKAEAESDEDSNTSCETIRPAKIPKLELSIKKEPQNPKTEYLDQENVPFSFEDIFDMYFGDIAAGSSNQFNDQQAIVTNHEVSDDKNCVLGTFKCDLCPQSFSSACFLKKHKKEHNWEFVCEICNKKFKTNKKLKNHMRADHRKKKQNNESSIKGFKKQPTIQYTVNERNQPKMFICPSCNAEIKGKGTFRNHKKSHTTVKMEPKMEPKTEFMDVKEEPILFSFRGVKIEMNS